MVQNRRVAIGKYEIGQWFGLAPFHVGVFSRGLAI